MEGNLFVHHPQAFLSFDVLNRKYGLAKNTAVTSNKFYDSSVSLQRRSVARKCVHSLCRQFPATKTILTYFLFYKNSHLIFLWVHWILFLCVQWKLNLQKAQESKLIVWTPFSSRFEGRDSWLKRLHFHGRERSQEKQYLTRY